MADEIVEQGANRGDNLPVKQEKTGNRWEPGQSGNPGGRPVKPEIAELRVALAEVKSEQGESLLKNCIRRAYNDTPMAIAILKKLLPDLSEGAGSSEMRTLVVELIERYNGRDGSSDTTAVRVIQAP